MVVAGGHAAFNPEPVADFVDAAVLGDGEEIVGDITDVVRDWKAAGPPGRAARAAAAAGRDRRLLRAVALRRRPTAPTARSPRSRPADDRVPATVTKRTTTDLDAWPYPKAPLVPLAETVHERVSVEIFRGCTRGCRFCQAGMITRPVRERSLAGIGEMVDAAVRASGFDEVGLLSLSSADHSRDRRDHQGPGRPLRGHQHLAVAALHPGGRVQHRPGQRDLPQRPPLRADLRPGGRFGADPPCDQQDGVRGGPHPHRQRRRSPRAGGR